MVGMRRRSFFRSGFSNLARFRALSRFRAVLFAAVLVCVALVMGAPSVLLDTPSPLPTVIPSGYYRVENRGGVWWLIDPLGVPTLSIGVDNVVYAGDRIRGTGPSPYLQAVEQIYPDRSAWDRRTLDRLRAWGFNTLGAWSDAELSDLHTPYTLILDFAARSGADWLRGRPVDVYDPRFEATAHEIARREATPREHDPMLIGYFSDNELWWGPDWRRRDTMLASYLSLPAGAPGRMRAIEFLQARYGSAQRLGRAWHVAVRDFAHVPARAATRAYRADADAFLGNVLLCLPIVGVNLFEKAVAASAKGRELLLKSKGIEARAIDSPEGFVVRAGSNAVKVEVPSIQAFMAGLRRTLVDKGVLVDGGDVYRLSQDYTFNSPSTAAGVLLGRSANGRIEWKDAMGRSLKEIQEQTVGES